MRYLIGRENDKADRIMIALIDIIINIKNRNTISRRLIINGCQSGFETVE